MIIYEVQSNILHGTYGFVADGYYKNIELVKKYVQEKLCPYDDIGVYILRKFKMGGPTIKKVEEPSLDFVKEEKGIGYIIEGQMGTKRVMYRIYPIEVTENI